VRVSIGDSDDLRRLNKQLHQQADGKELRKELNAAFRAVMNPIRDQVKAAYLAAPAYRGRRFRQGPPLRTLLAKATRTEIRTAGKMAGIRVRVDGRKMPSGMKSLPAYYEGYKRPWRHPVHGDRETWRAQPARPTFDRTVEPHEDEAGRAIEQAIEQVRRKLERG
jgi:hypothetical protein